MTAPTDLQPEGAAPGARYAFDNSAPEAVDQLTALQTYLDPITTSILDQIPIRRGGRCLELGAGRGSITRWLAHRVGPTGHVTAVDLDTRHLRSMPNVDIRRHDIRTGLPDGGPYDLIHARLVLIHLPQRRRMLRTLIESLAPGGWLVIGEFTGQPLHLITTPSTSDGAIFTHVIHTLTRVLRQHGVDLDWAHQIHPDLTAAGLTHVHTVEHAESWTGGGNGCRLHHANSVQMHDQLLDAGITETELVRFRHLLRDPRFAARSWQFLCTRGQKPSEDA
jgi:protein-L-isoaspartate O-methyltransferase